MKNKVKSAIRYVWELFKSSILPSMMYCCLGWALVAIIPNDEAIVWTSSKRIWSIVLILLGIVYHAFVAWVNGGSQYEMLASGNLKRTSAAAGGEYRMSKHKIAKEYRAWKGFVIGFMTSALPMLVVVLLACNQQAVHAETKTKGISFLILVALFLCNWATIPFYGMNEAGIYVSYWVALPLSAFPILVGGVMYIVGAYSRRNKNMRLRMLEDKAAAEEAARRANPKINYGGLPGTKPKKRK